MADATAETLINGLECTLDRIGDALQGESATPVSDAIHDGLKRVADAITPCAAGGTDAIGGHVGSLTEAVMGTTAALCRIADAMNNVAEAIREHRERAGALRRTSAQQRKPTDR